MCFGLQSSQLMPKMLASEQQLLGHTALDLGRSRPWGFSHLRHRTSQASASSGEVTRSFLFSFMPFIIHPITSEDSLPLCNYRWFLIFPFPAPWPSTFLCLSPSSVSVTLSSHAAHGVSVSFLQCFQARHVSSIINVSCAI